LADTEKLVENPGIIFPHKNHLKPGGITMSCGDCHKPEPGGAGMLPITMDAVCHDCHQLNFDPDNLKREVPHGDVKRVVSSLREYYAAKALAGGYIEPGAPVAVRARRLIGQELSEAQALGALAWADNKLPSSCIDCHGFHIAPTATMVEPQ